MDNQRLIKIALVFIFGTRLLPPASAAGPVLFMSVEEVTAGSILRYTTEVTSLLTSPLHGLKLSGSHARALSSSYSQQEIVFVDELVSKANFAFLNFTVENDQIPNDSATKERVLATATHMITSITYDWVSGNIYWSDDAFNWIVLLNPRTSNWRVIVEDNLRHPSSIIVHPVSSKIFWSDDLVGQIERSSLSGQDREIIVANRRPVSMAIDFTQNTIFWFDADDTLRACDLDGSNQRQLRTVTVEFTAITAYKNTVYGASSQGQMSVYNLSDDTHISLSLRNTKVFDVHMFCSDDQQDKQSPCEYASCSQLCVATSNGSAQCLCRHGYTLTEDNITCAEISSTHQPYYLAAWRGKLGIISAPDGQFKVLFTINWVNITDLDFNSERGLIYALHGHPQQISGFNMADNTSVTIVTAVAGITIGGFSVDWLSENVYWTDNHSGRIFATRFPGKYSATILDQITKPTSIKVDSFSRRLYWVEDGTSIWRAGLDGSDKEQIVASSDIGVIAVDFIHNGMYWTDGEAIRRMTWDTARPEFYKRLAGSSLTSLAVFEDFIVWTERRRRDDKDSISWSFHQDADVSYSGVASSQDGFTHVTAVTSHNQPRRDTPDACTVNNGGCDQVCLMTSSGDRTCRCGVGHQVNQSSCVTQKPLENNFLMLADAFHEAVFQMELYTNSTRYLPLASRVSASKMTYDHANQTLFWTDDSQRGKYFSVDVGRENALVQEVLVAPGAQLGGIAYDPRHNRVYLANKSNRTILRLDGTTPTVVTSDIKTSPRDLVLDTSNRKLYWTETGGDGLEASILKADMDRLFQRPVPIITEKIQDPLHLALHPDGEEIYWYDSYFNSLNKAKVDGSGREVLLQRRCLGLAVDVNFLFAIGPDFGSPVLAIFLKDNTTFPFGPEGFLLPSAINVMQLGSPPPLPRDVTPEPTGSNTGIIVGACVGAGVGLILLIIVVVILCRRTRFSALKRRSSGHTNAYLESAAQSNGSGVRASQPPQPPPLRRTPNDRNNMNSATDEGYYNSIIMEDRSQAYREMAMESPEYIDKSLNPGQQETNKKPLTVEASSLSQNSARRGPPPTLTQPSYLDLNQPLSPEMQAMAPFPNRISDAYVSSPFDRHESGTYEVAVNRESEMYERPINSVSAQNQYEAPVIESRESQTYEHPVRDNQHANANVNPDLINRESETYERPTYDRESSGGYRESETYERPVAGRQFTGAQENYESNLRESEAYEHALADRPESNTYEMPVKHVHTTSKSHDDSDSDDSDDSDRPGTSITLPSAKELTI